MNNSPTMKQFSAWLPVVMSLAALATVLTHLVLFGAAREPDEGPAAHIFQLLILLQVPIVAFFAIKWMPRKPGRTLQILALQAITALAALAPVFLLKL